MSKPHLFCKADEQVFKQQFAIQWLAAHEAVQYQSNCYAGWAKLPVEDAQFLAEKAWDMWAEVNGVSGDTGND